MSITCGFFDAVNHDRQYNATAMSSIFDGIINDGVFDSVGGCLMVAPGSGLSVNVRPGRAWFNHTWTASDANIPIVLTAAEMTLGRIDAIVLEVNSSISIRNNVIKVITGTPAGTPVKPTLINTEDVHQHALAYVTVAAQATTIVAANIENVVGTAETPFVTGILETADITVLYQQWQAIFDAWFANLEYVLDGDVAGHLQNEINELEATAATTYNGTTEPSAALGRDGDSYVKLQ